MIIPKINFPIYGIIIIISMIIGLIYVSVHLKKYYKAKDYALYYLLYFFFAFSLSKVVTIILSGEGNIITAGFSSYGALIGAIVITLTYEKLVPSEGNLLKYTLLSMILVYSLSKISCSVVGCCGGIPYEGLFKIKYLNMMNIWQFPIQIVEVISFMILFIILHLKRNYKYINYVVIISGALLKFSLDFLRYDHVKKIISGNQIISILIIVTVIIMLIIKRKKEEK